eukprot:488084-Rhodomonas_salina.1
MESSSPSRAERTRWWPTGLPSLYPLRRTYGIVHTTWARSQISVVKVEGRKQQAACWRPAVTTTTAASS